MASRIKFVQNRTTNHEPEPSAAVGSDANRITGTTPEPNGTVGGADEFIDPTSAETTDSTGSAPSASAKRKSGKRSANTNRASANKREPKEKDSENLTALLFSTHLMLAKLTSVKELVLNEVESKELAIAINRVNSLFDFSVLSPKTIAVINLLAVTGGIYGPRIMAVSMSAPKAKKGPQTIDGEGHYAAASAK